MQKLTKLQSKHSNFRTDDVLGQADRPPVAGEPFVFVGESLDAEIKSRGGKRFITTTAVVELLERDGIVEFKTLNSTYRLESLD